jgi:hypothetical protein
MREYGGRAEGVRAPKDLRRTDPTLTSRICEPYFQEPIANEIYRPNGFYPCVSYNC